MNITSHPRFLPPQSMMTKPAALLFAVVSIFSFGPAGIAADSPKPAQPNILFILTDDQGYGDWSINGHPLLKTPHVDNSPPRACASRISM